MNFRAGYSPQSFITLATSCMFNFLRRLLRFPLLLWPPSLSPHVAFQLLARFSKASCWPWRFLIYLLAKIFSAMSSNLMMMIWHA